MVRLELAAIALVVGAHAVSADVPSLPTLTPSRPIDHDAPGTRVNTRIDANAASDVAVVWTETSGQDGDRSGIYLSLNGEAELPVNVTTTDHQEGADVSMAADGSVVVTWTNAGNEVRWRSFDSDGVGGSEMTAFGGQSPAVDHYSDGRFIIVGIGPGLAVLAQRYLADGTPDGGTLTVSSGVPAGRVRVAISDDDDVGIVWSNPPGTIIQMRIIEPDGTPLGPDFPAGLSANPVDGLDVDHGVGGFHLAWSFPGLVMTRLVEDDGTLPQATANVNVGVGPTGVTALPVAGALVVHNDGPDLLGRCVDDIGNPFGPAPVLDDVGVAAMSSVVHDGTHLHLAFVALAGQVRLRSSRSFSVGVAAGPAAEPPIAVPTVFRSSTRFEFSGGAAGDPIVTVLDASGRLVRSLVGICDNGPCGATWDGRTVDGTPAAPGVYFIRGPGSGVARVVRLR